MQVVSNAQPSVIYSYAFEIRQAQNGFIVKMLGAEYVFLDIDSMNDWIKEFYNKGEK